MLSAHLKNTTICEAPRNVFRVLSAKFQTRCTLLAKGQHGNFPKTASQKYSTSTMRVTTKQNGRAKHVQTVSTALHQVASPRSPCRQLAFGTHHGEPTHRFTHVHDPETAERQMIPTQQQQHVLPTLMVHCVLCACPITTLKPLPESVSNAPPQAKVEKLVS